MNLIEIGWNDFFAKHFEPFKAQELIPARIACVRRNGYLIYCEFGELNADLTGKLRYQARTAQDLPAVGDWVAMKSLGNEFQVMIFGLLPRKSSFSRKVAGNETQEQVVAANVDTVFIVNSLDQSFSPARIERYLTVANNSQAMPVIILNKADLCPNIEEVLAKMKLIALDIPVHIVSATENTGIAELRKYLSIGKTVALVGSSGVGKSTIINCLLGEERQRVESISNSTGKGKHVTTSRELILLPTGGMLIDNPGMRELQLWADETNLNQTFEDIKELASQCRFNDCQHKHEPGCAVRKAIQQGSLDMKRFKNYLKLQREIRFLATRRRERWYHSKQTIHKNIELKRKGVVRE